MILDSIPAVTNWIWSNGRFLGDGGWAHDGDLAEICGQFAIVVRRDDDTTLLARDRLGVNKLFYARDDRGAVHAGNHYYNLRRAGFAAGAIYSVPPGHALTIAADGRCAGLRRLERLRFGAADIPLADLGKSIRSALDATFERLQDALRGRRAFVTLSGGLDSTSIAALARHHLPGVEAVTFQLGNPEDVPSPGSDLESAIRVADALRMPLRKVHVGADELVNLLDLVLVAGQDWRDFNVHCGLVNAGIGLALGRQLGASAGPRPVVLTGDIMNELVADYSAESYAGQEYYRLPNIPKGVLRRHLVDGLDAGDREVGIFACFGLDTLQPYALCAEAYTGIPPKLLESAHAKNVLARAIMGSAVPEHVYGRPKVRAQTASSAGVSGTLALLADRGIDAGALRERFHHLMGAAPGELDDLIRAGMYRAEPFAGEVGRTKTARG